MLIDDLMTLCKIDIPVGDHAVRFENSLFARERVLVNGAVVSSFRNFRWRSEHRFEIEGVPCVVRLKSILQRGALVLEVEQGGELVHSGVYSQVNGRPVAPQLTTGESRILKAMLLLLVLSLGVLPLPIPLPFKVFSYSLTLAGAYVTLAHQLFGRTLNRTLVLQGTLVSILVLGILAALVVGAVHLRQRTEVPVVPARCDQSLLEQTVTRADSVFAARPYRSRNLPVISVRGDTLAKRYASTPCDCDSTERASICEETRRAFLPRMCRRFVALTGCAWVEEMVDSTDAIQCRLRYTPDDCRTYFAGQ